MIKYLTREKIIENNRRVILEFGGHLSFYNDNLLNENSLDYLIEAPRQILFGEERYPSIYEKAASYAFHIIRDHVFIDGDKRTGILCMYEFLEINGYYCDLPSDNDFLVQLALDIAYGKIEIPQIAALLKELFHLSP